MVYLVLLTTQADIPECFNSRFVDDVIFAIVELPAARRKRKLCDVPQLTIHGSQFSFYGGYN